MHRPLRILSTALITAGLVVMADVALTLLWQEPVSAAYASLQQSRANDELVELESEFDPGDVGFLSANASEAWNVSPPDSVRTARRRLASPWSMTANSPLSWARS